MPPIHDYVIANQTGANTRSDLNNAFSAIVSNNSSATEPTTTYAYMWWADTGNDLLKQRNAADSAWISILTLSTGAVSSGGATEGTAVLSTGETGGTKYLREDGDGTSSWQSVSSDPAMGGDLTGTASNAQIAANAVGLAEMAGGTDGNLITYDASGDPAYVTTGTSGQILTSGGTGVAPTFQTAAGGGKVLQVVSTTKTDTFTTTTTGSWVDITGLSATITPSSTSSKVLVNINIKGGGVLALNVTEFRLVRGSTVINKGDPAGSRNQGFSGTISSDASDAPSTSTNYLDSPGLATALTYKIQLHSNNTSYINMSSADANNANTVRQTSDITLSEIGA